MFLSPQFLSVRMVIREELQKSYKKIENIFYLTKKPFQANETVFTKNKIYANLILIFNGLGNGIY
jgi:hypothetical protein